MYNILLNVKFNLVCQVNTLIHHCEAVLHLSFNFKVRLAIDMIKIVSINLQYSLYFSQHNRYSDINQNCYVLSVFPVLQRNDGDVQQR